MRSFPISHTTDGHFSNLVNFMLQGRVIPFLGAGANQSSRPLGAIWDVERSDYLPSGSELSRHLATSFSCPPSDISEIADLLHVSEYVALTSGSGALYRELHDVFNRDYPLGNLHRFFATWPGLLREKGYPVKYQVIVTTNYDDLLERAFREAGEPFDLVIYLAEGSNRGKFLHVAPDGRPCVIDVPNRYGSLSLDCRSVILKLHGAVDRSSPEGDDDSFVITEDHYIDYLTRTDLANLVPVTLAAKLRRSHFLFLGYGLRDWNLRVILHRIAGAQSLTYKSWAVQLEPTALDQKFWERRDVDIVDMSLDRYIAALRARTLMLPGAAEVVHARETVHRADAVL
jgi:SIR2-like domain